MRVLLRDSIHTPMGVQCRGLRVPGLRDLRIKDLQRDRNTNVTTTDSFVLGRELVFKKEKVQRSVSWSQCLESH